jgi:hypothetical protein
MQLTRGLVPRKLNAMGAFRFFLLGYMVAAMASSLNAASEIRVPFNFQWGDSMTRVEQSLSGTKANIVERKKTSSGEVLVVQGIPQRHLDRTVFYFKDGGLSEVELQYGNNSWDTSQYERFFDEVRRNVDKKYGLGRLVVRDRNREQDVLMTLAGYQWVQGFMSLRLFFYTAEKNGESMRVLSLHYREV